MSHHAISLRKNWLILYKYTLSGSKSKQRINRSYSNGNGISILKSEFPAIKEQHESFGITLLEALRRHSEEQLNRPAFVNFPSADGEDINANLISFGDFYSCSYSVASFLESLGFGYGDVAGVILPNCWQYLSIFLASIIRGGCITGANVSQTDLELTRQLQDSNCKIIFCSDNRARQLVELKKICPKLQFVVSVNLDGTSSSTKDIISFENALSFSISKTAENQDNINADKDLLLLPYSSGTTGHPKGVMLTHKNYGTMVRIFNNHFDNYIFRKMDPNWDWKNEALPLVLPFHHIYGFALGLNSILAGGCGVILKKFDLETFLRSIQNYQTKCILVVPPILVYLAKSSLVSKYDLSSLRFIMTGAAPSGKDLCDQIQTRFKVQLCQGYGMTEASMASHLPVFGTNNPMSVGRLASNFEMKIVDLETRAPVKIGETGEILVRGPTVMLGYLNNPKATADTIDNDGWLSTGDVGYLDQDGWTYVVDRIKELIKVMGYQVAPAELEDLLLSHPGVRDCAVIGVPDKFSGESPKAYVVKADQNLTPDDIIKFVKGRVSNYKQLRGGVEFLDEIPKSPSGKILRRNLRNR